MTKPLLLDLFCGAGGAAEGYSLAGFEVVGIDVEPQPNYPFEFVRRDAMRIPNSYLEKFDVVHASPPCQAYSDLAARTGNAHAWPKLIKPVRKKLAASGKLTILENVEGAPMPEAFVLCGTMFDNLRVLRHRLFEVNFPIEVPECEPHPLVHTLDKRRNHYGKTDEWKDFVQVTGGGNCSVDAASDAMGIDWMTKRELNESIPPAYTEYVGRWAMKALHASRQKKVA